ncbi:MAG: hypothetical protein M3R60_02390, partial [Pseudomonadota bacterium]|nr:hypothetical protein [Pseudomonadota bacterium]
MPTSSFPRLRRFVAARLSPEGQTGLHLTVGVILMVAAAWLFGDLAEDVVNNEAITLLDVQIANWFHANATVSMTRFMLLVSNLNGMVGAPIMAALLAAYFYWKREHFWVFFNLFVVPW